MTIKLATIILFASLFIMGLCLYGISQIEFPNIVCINGYMYNQQKDWAFPYPNLEHHLKCGEL